MAGCRCNVRRCSSWLQVWLKLLQTSSRGQPMTECLRDILVLRTEFSTTTTSGTRKNAASSDQHGIDRERAETG